MQGGRSRSDFETIAILDIDANTQRVLYEGVALRGTRTIEPGWAILQYVYDLNGNITGTLRASTDMNQVWDNRAALNYL